MLIATILSASTGIFAQTTNITGPAGNGQFGYSVTVLTNDKYVVTDPSWDNGATADVGAVTWCICT